MPDGAGGGAAPPVSPARIQRHGVQPVGWRGAGHGSRRVSRRRNRVGHRPQAPDDVDSWPADVDDSAARHDWGFAPRYDFARAFNDYLLPIIRERYAKPRLILWVRGTNRRYRNKKFRRSQAHWFFDLLVLNSCAPRNEHKTKIQKIAGSLMP